MSNTGENSTVKAGLEDVIATTSAICFIDGEHGVLSYRGFDIHDLAARASFEEVCFLLWYGHLPNRDELGALESQLAEWRVLPEHVVRLMRSLPPGNGMDALRTLTSALAHSDPDAAYNSPEANARKAIRLTAQLATLVLSTMPGNAEVTVDARFLGHSPVSLSIDPTVAHTIQITLDGHHDLVRIFEANTLVPGSSEPMLLRMREK